MHIYSPPHDVLPIFQINYCYQVKTPEKCYLKAAYGKHIISVESYILSSKIHILHATLIFSFILIHNNIMKHI